MEKGGNLPCVMNAANEIAVRLFLEGKIGFNDIPKFIEQVMGSCPFIEKPSIEQLLESDREARDLMTAKA